MDSNTSSDLDIEYLDNKGNKFDLNSGPTKKAVSSDTDLYLGLLANKSKEIAEEKIDISSSSIKKNSDKYSTSSESSARSKRSTRSNVSSEAKFESFNVNKKDSYKDEKYLTPQELKMKKIELLRKLSEIKAKGYKLSKDYDFNSSIEEMEYEYQLLRSFANKRNGIRLYKNILVNAASVIEFLNDRYDPFSFKLSGWSEHMSVEVDSYEEVLEELYEKYKGTGSKMAPELKLLLLVLASASAFHFSKATLQSMPMADQFMKSKPDFVARMINPERQQSQFMTQQEINMEQQRQAAIQREKQQRMRKQTQVKRATPIVPNAPKKIVKKVNKQPENLYQNAHHPITKSSETKEKVDINIKAPENVQDILKRLHAKAENNSSKPSVKTSINSIETQDETSSDNDRIVSDTTLTSDTEGNKVKRRGRKKKSVLTII